MTLAAILAIYFLSVAGPGLGSPADMRAAAQGQAPEQNSAATSHPQPPPAQTTSPPPASAAPAGQAQTSPSPAKPSAKPRAHHKKANVPDCATSSVAGSADAHSAPTEPVGGAAPVKPCPPPIIVIKNGGSDEPVVELKGNTSAEQASYQRFTTEQLTAATEENLKKIGGRELKPGEQEMVSQIKQFMEQAKSAVTEGDLNRGHNLAVKARLLSDELVKP
ncbi:MAG: hypothetical protein WAM04_19200 [Candidatus Sulfotelmatobacter sp.]